MIAVQSHKGAKLNDNTDAVMDFVQKRRPNFVNAPDKSEPDIKNDDRILEMKRDLLKKQMTNFMKKDGVQIDLQAQLK